MDTTFMPAKMYIKPTKREYLDQYRKWQGIPSVERTQGGRLYVDFYSGMETETNGNFIVVITSNDDGKSWCSPALIIEHEDPLLRLYDPCIWTDPLDRLWLIWNQSHDFFDGRMGVWVSICENPDAPLEQTVWSVPKRIANGLMINKPLVLNNGEWLFPCAIWKCQEPTQNHPDLENERYSNVYVTADQGESFTLRGGADVPNRSFDEHAVIEKRDGSLWMLVRCFDGIGESFSYDGGRTWTPGKKSDIEGPCSRFHIRRLASGRLLLINHYGFGERSTMEELEAMGNVKAWRGRTHLTALLSEDDGKTWPYHLLLDIRNNAAYPDAVVAEDGSIYVVYDYERYTCREILMAHISEEDIIAGHLVNENSYLRRVINKALATKE